MRTGSKETLSQLICGRSPVTESILFFLCGNSIYLRGFPNKVIDQWSQDVARGELPNEFDTPEEMIMVCELVYDNPKITITQAITVLKKVKKEYGNIPTSKLKERLVQYLP